MMMRSLRLLGVASLLATVSWAQDADQHEDGEERRYEQPNTDVSSEQFEALHRQIDEDGDGKLSVDELYSFGNSTRFGIAMNERYTDHILSRLDRDGDGSVDINEELPEEGGVFDSIKFAAADIDGDGQLSSEELSYMLVPELNEEVLDKVLDGAYAHIDTDGDGKINKEELVKQLSQMFSLEGAEEVMYLPEFIQEQRVLTATEDAENMFMVNNPELRKTTSGLGYRVDAQLEAKSSKEQKWGTKVSGVMVDGWLQVNMSEVKSSAAQEPEKEAKGKVKAVFLPEFVKGTQVLRATGEEGVFVVEVEALATTPLANTTGLGYRFTKSMDAKHTRKEAQWGSKLKGNLTDGWLQVEKYLGKVAPPLYLPEFIDGSRVLSPMDEDNMFLVENTELQANASGLGYRLSKSLEAKHSRKQVAWGSRVNGTLSDGWLRVDKNLGKPPPPLYLPEFLNGSRVLMVTEEDGIFWVQNSELQSNASGLGYRVNMSLDAKHGWKQARWGSKVKGKLSDGWLLLVKYLGVPPPKLYLPEFINGVRVLSSFINATTKTAEDGVFLVLNSELQSNASGLGYRLNKHLEAKHTKRQVPWGGKVNGTLSDGWLLVDKYLGKPPPTLYLPEFVNESRVLAVTQEEGVYLVEKPDLLVNTSGLGYRLNRSLGAKHRKIAPWGSKIRGSLSDGWLQVEKFLGRSKIVYLPEFVNEVRVLSATGESGVFLVTNAIANTSGLGYRHGRRLEAKIRNREAPWGCKVRGILSNGWLQVDFAQQAEIVYLPEFINDERVLLATRVPGVLLVDHAALRSNTSGLAFRYSESLEHKLRREVPWRSKVTGTLKGGWLSVEKVLGKAKVQFLPEFINESRVLTKTAEAGVFLVANAEVQATNATGLGYRTNRRLEAKHGRREAAWGSSIRGVLADGWLQIDQDQILGGEVLYLPEMLNDERVLTPTNETGEFLVSHTTLQDSTSGLGYRYSATLEHKRSGMQVTWGSTVTGVLTDGWLRVSNVTVAAKVKRTAQKQKLRLKPKSGAKGAKKGDKDQPKKKILYLPEFIDDERVLTQSRERGLYLVGNEALKEKGLTGLGFRNSKDMKDKNRQQVKWGKKVPGDLADGWLAVVFTRGGDDGGEEQDDRDTDPGSRAFADLDRDGDGQISRRELISIATGNLDHEMSMEQVLEALDKNKDQHVTLEELKGSHSSLMESEGIYHVMDWVQHHEL